MSNERLPLDRLRKQITESSPEGSEPISDADLIKVRQEVGKRLLEAFGGERLGILSHIAKALKSSPAVVKRYLDGDRFPTAEILIEFRRSTGRTIDWMLTGDDRAPVQIQNKFSAAEEKEIRELAARSGRTFDEEVKRLAIAGKDAVKNYLK
ncbi:MAG: hypothetical protein INR69_22045 [Mucilaginibacter polytrichastri]|nr:hypothetical protein [Mucilaginibacter polytrichastri]